VVEGRHEVCGGSLPLSLSLWRWENSVHRLQRRIQVFHHLWPRPVSEQLNGERWGRQQEGDQDCDEVEHKLLRSSFAISSGKVNPLKRVWEKPIQRDETHFAESDKNDSCPRNNPCCRKATGTNRESTEYSFGFYFESIEVPSIP
jgi:hypothetical protein